MWTAYIEGIIDFLKNSQHVLCIEVDMNNNIISYNEAFEWLNLEEPAKKKLDDYFQIIESHSKIHNVRLLDINDPEASYTGIRIINKDNYLYLVERNGHVDNEIMERMDEINMELSNLTREINKKNRDLKSKNKTITSLMFTDTLTKLNNRRFLYSEFDLLADHYKRGEVENLIISIIDIDKFKGINDTYGHDFGDEVLVAFADLLTKFSRNSDVRVRFGGDEFILIYVDTSLDLVEKRLEDILKTFKQTSFEGVDYGFSASFGVTLYKPGENFSSFIKRADDALYISKDQGRSRITIKK